MADLFQFIQFDRPGTSKHDTLVQGIKQSIDQKAIHIGQPLPSITTFMKELSISRMTVVKALEELKSSGIIESKKRIGYFVTSENTFQELKIMLFLTAFNSYQEKLYNALLNELQPRNISIDLFFHHCNPHVFASLIKENLHKYGLFLITPINDKEAIAQLNKIPEDKLLQVGRSVEGGNGGSIISQDFFREVIRALEEAADRITKYKKFVLVFSSKSYHPVSIKNAFTVFCTRHNMDYSIAEKPVIDRTKRGHAYFIIDDSHLIQLIKDAESHDFKVGRDIGVLSYNDTPMKEIIRDGITVISTDFELMGKKAAHFIMNRSPVRDIIRTRIIFRKSL